MAGTYTLYGSLGSDVRVTLKVTFDLQQWCDSSTRNELQPVSYTIRLFLTLLAKQNASTVAGVCLTQQCSNVS